MQPAAALRFPYEMRASRRRNVDKPYSASAYSASVDKIRATRASLTMITSHHHDDVLAHARVATHTNPYRSSFYGNNSDDVVLRAGVCAIGAVAC